MAENQPLLSVNSLSKAYGNTVVVEDVSFSLTKREVLGIIGPSGCGKSTLLKCINLLETPESGRIDYPNGLHFDPVSLERFSKSDYDLSSPHLNVEECYVSIRKQIGMIFQSLNLWEDRSVLDNILLGPKVVLKVDEEVAHEQASQLAERFGLKSKLTSKVWQLSGGERQRVAIIRALIMEPQVLLLDEVTTSLDPLLVVELMDFLWQLKGDGLTMILVTHHLEFAASICNKIMFMHQGKCVQIGTPNEILETPENPLVQKFVAAVKLAR